MFCQFTLVTCKPDLSLKFWAHFQLSTQHLHWMSSGPLQPDGDKTDLLSFTSKSAIPMVFLISVNGLSVPPLAEANVLFIGNLLKNVTKLVHFLLLDCYRPSPSASHQGYGSSLFAGLSVSTLAFTTFSIFHTQIGWIHNVLFFRDKECMPVPVVGVGEHGGE